MPRPHNYYLRTVYDVDEDIDDFELEVEDNQELEDTSEAEISLNVCICTIKIGKRDGANYNTTSPSVHPHHLQTMQRFRFARLGI